MRIGGMAFLILWFSASYLMFSGSLTHAGEVSASNIIVAQSIEQKKWKTRDGREGCSIQCKDGSQASHVCDKPNVATCSCNCTQNSAGAAYCWCR